MQAQAHECDLVQHAAHEAIHGQSKYRDNNTSTHKGSLATAAAEAAAAAAAAARK